MLLTPTWGITSNFYFILNSQQHFIQVADILRFHFKFSATFYSDCWFFLCCLPRLEAWRAILLLFHFTFQQHFIQVADFHIFLVLQIHSLSVIIIFHPFPLFVAIFIWFTMTINMEKQIPRKNMFQPERRLLRFDMLSSCQFSRTRFASQSSIYFTQ